jgi:glycerophosphoryl diester phosphodiesterase
MKRPLLLGHRGVRGLKAIRENTIAAFDRALADGCDGFELDVRLTRDGAAVVWHDAKVRLLKVAHTPAARLSRLPRLEDAVLRYHSNAFLDIELKVPGLEELTVALLRKHPPARGYVVSSFLPEVLRSLYVADPGTCLGWICEDARQLSLWKELPVQYVIIDRKIASLEVLHQLKKARKKVFVWTVNNPVEMRRFAELGVDGIISDKADLLCRTLNEESGTS